MSFGKIPPIDFMSSLFFSGFKAFAASTCFIRWSSNVFICFPNALLTGEYVNFACSIILFWADGLFLYV